MVPRKVPGNDSEAAEMGQTQ